MSTPTDTSACTSNDMRPTGSSSSSSAHRPRDERRLPWYHLLLTGLAGLLVAVAVLAIADALSVASAILLGFVLHLLFGWGYSLVREGLRNREIADRIYVSLRTVEIRLTRIYRRFGVRSRTELIAKLSGTAEAVAG